MILTIIMAGGRAESARSVARTHSRSTLVILSLRVFSGSLVQASRIPW